MRNLKHIILMLSLVIGLALSVPAQSDDQKRPPKNPPVRDPKPKPPRENPPKGDDKPKKPGMSFYLVVSDRNSDIA